MIYNNDIICKNNKKISLKKPKYKLNFPTLTFDVLNLLYLILIISLNLKIQLIFLST